MLPKQIDIDWEWVKRETQKREKISPAKNSDAAASIQKCLDSSIAKAKTLTRSNYIQTVKKISTLGKDFIELEGGIRLSTSKITKLVKGATHIVIFLVTIGDLIETKAGDLTLGKEPLEGYLLDRIGSFAVESLAESLEAGVRKDYMKQKKSVSMRYSPGYCDWPIEEQEMLNKLLDFSKIGVSLNESYMMKPKKSISAMVAIADKGIFTKTGSTCEICEMKDCTYRRGT